MHTNIKFHILVGDITTINSDVIVNTANFRLLGGGGVDGAIHKAGGEEILKECKVLKDTIYPNGLPVGEAVITTAGNMKADYVIHTVGPRYKFDNTPRESLISCYEHSLLLADKKGCISIAFPSISTGVYAYPLEEASTIAYETLLKVSQKCTNIRDIIFVFFNENDAKYLRNLI